MQNAKMCEFKEREQKSYGGLWKMQSEGDEESGYHLKKGIVEHDLGVVVFNQYKSWPTEHWRSSTKEYRNLRLSIVMGGREYIRSWDAWYGEKTIARLANNFIEEIKGDQS